MYDVLYDKISFKKPMKTSNKSVRRMVDPVAKAKKGLCNKMTNSDNTTWSIFCVALGMMGGAFVTMRTILGVIAMGLLLVVAVRVKMAEARKGAR